MNHPAMSFYDVDWSFVNHVENADFKTKSVTVVMNNNNRFSVIVPRELFLGIWDGGENHVMDQDAKRHDDTFLGDGELH